MLLIVDVHPYLGPPYTLLAFIVVILGGMGSLPGALLGGILHRHVGSDGRHPVLQPSLKTAFSFGLLILVLLFRPQGLLGEKCSDEAGLVGECAAHAGWCCWRCSLAGAGRRAVSRQQLHSQRSHHRSVLRLYRPGVESDAGLRRALSLGHALFVGIGAYTSAALFIHFRHSAGDRCLRRRSRCQF